MVVGTWGSTYSLFWAVVLASNMSRASLPVYRGEPTNFNHTSFLPATAQLLFVATAHCLEQINKPDADFGFIATARDWAIAHFAAKILIQCFAINLPMVIDKMAEIVIDAYGA